jgi:hypothetical protein
MNSLTKREYESGVLYSSLYELKGEELFKEIAAQDMQHYNYLVGHGYAAIGEDLEYPLSLEGAIKSKQDSIEAIKNVMIYATADSALKADLERILGDEKEALDELIQYSLEERETESSLLDMILHLDIEGISKKFHLDAVGEAIRNIFTRVKQKNEGGEMK